MEIKAKVKHLKISPRKVRLVADLVRGLEVEKALAQLKFTNKRSISPISKLINSAIASAVNNYDLDRNNLFVKEIRVDEGVTMKRWMPRAHGRATTIRKRTSHVNLVLGELKDSGIVKAKKQKIEKPVNLEEAVKQMDKKSAKEDSNKKDKETKPEGISQDKSKSAPKKGFAGKFFQRKSG